MFGYLSADIIFSVNSFPRVKLQENCELRGMDKVRGKISKHIFKVKWRLLSLLSFKCFFEKTRIWEIFPGFR